MHKNLFTSISYLVKDLKLNSTDKSSLVNFIR